MRVKPAESVAPAAPIPYLPPLADPYEGCAGPGARREADILDARVLVTEALAIHLAIVKAEGAANPALYGESDLIVPRLLEAANRLSAGWAANVQVPGPLPPRPTPTFMRFVRQLIHGGWTRPAVTAAVAELDGLFADGGVA